MVLSNKKLKQKLRAVKAELITDSGAQSNFSDKKHKKSQDVGSKTSESLRTILNLEAQRSKSSKRERPKRVKQSPITLAENAVTVKKEERSGDVDQKLQDGPGADNMQVEKKKLKKRKRDESETSDNVKKEKRDGSEASENIKKKKRKQKKRPRQWWMIKKKKNDKSKIEEMENGTVKEVENGTVREEGVNQKGSGSTGEQPVAKADESIENVRKEISPKVYVGGIPYYSTEDDIRSFFEGCGTITCIDCMTFPDTGKFRGIAIITFKTEAAAKRALALDGSDMGGLFLKVQPFKSASKNKLPNFSPSVADGYNRIYVGNLSWDITEDDLRNILAGCTIKSIRFGEDKETGEFKGYAHVDFADSASLNTSLKLDQTLVCGRPIRVSCAVLKNSAASMSKPTPKYDQFDTSNEVTTARIKAPPQGNQVFSDHVSEAVGDQVTSSETNAVSAKIRRRTCYECGERGHLSSACPKIQAADPTNQDNHVDTGKEANAANLKRPHEDNQFYSYNYSAAVENQVTSSETNAVSSKIRRRTCYECGEKGHLSSACPKIQAADPTKPDNQVLSGKEVTAFSLKEYNHADTYDVSVAVENQAPSSEANATSSKIRRRTCYECGEKGHLSSACPKIQSVDPSKPDKQVDSGKEFTSVSLKATPENYQVNTYNVSSVAFENQAPSSEPNAISSKIRRRTCYECGEKGHLSSACPKAQAADPTNPGTT